MMAVLAHQNLLRDFWRVKGFLQNTKTPLCKGLLDPYRDLSLAPPTIMLMLLINFSISGNNIKAKMWVKLEMSTKVRQREKHPLGCYIRGDSRATCAEEGFSRFPRRNMTPCT